MTAQLDICNRALGKVGQGRILTSLDTACKEADLCSRLYDVCVARCIDRYNWSWCRKDEYITEDFLLDEVASFPWKYTFSVPQDYLRMIFCIRKDAPSAVDRFGSEEYLHVQQRNYNGAKVIVTNEPAPFVLEYHSSGATVDLFPPTLVEALESYLASELAAALVKGPTGAQIAQGLLQQAEALLSQAAQNDMRQDSTPYQKQSDVPQPWRFNSILRSRY